MLQNFNISRIDGSPTGRLSFFGLGYVGLVSSVCFAYKGFKVVGYDVDREKIRALRNRRIPINEPRLDELIGRIDQNRLVFTHSPHEAVLKTDITFLTVGTPSRRSGSIDLTYIKNAAKDVGNALRHKENYHLVVVRSTVTPETTENIVKRTIENYSNRKCSRTWGLCYCPEFLREGTAIEDMFNPDRIVIGEIDKKSGHLLEELFKRFHQGRTPQIIRTDIVNAELIKYASNAFLAMKISFVNEMANICERIKGADIEVVTRAMKLDKRIGKHYLNAGLGYGGSCLPKDVSALISFSKSLGYDPKLIEAVDRVNELQPYRVIEVARKLLRNLSRKKIALLGLSFKPDTDDLRNAVSIKLINKLLDERAEIAVYDPVAISKAREIFGNKITYHYSSIECIKHADCVIIVTEWDELRKLQPNDFLRNMRVAIVIDGRRIYEPMQFIKQGVKFAAIGLNRSTYNSSSNQLTTPSGSCFK
ncbi:MAG: UDP-glucose/GDP-mannose dehydrogenase family protein [Candidatus Bathyarchaeia archaeon]